VGISEDLYTTVYQDELKPIRSYVADNEVRVETVRLADTAMVADQLARGEVDIGLFTPVAYVRAHDRIPALRPFASHVINGTRYSQGYIVVRADAAMEDVAWLRGKRFAYTDADSFGGYLFPRYAVTRRGSSPDRFFGTTVQTGDYLESLRRVYAGDVDGAGVLDEVLRLGEAEGMPRKAFRVLAKSRRVPYMAYVARPDLPASTIDPLRRLLTGHRFKTFYLHVRNPLELPGPWARLRPRRNASWNINGFVTVTDRDFDEVRRMLRTVEARP
jgi:phosphonate transport system substrate-binding protein